MDYETLKEVTVKSLNNLTREERVILKEGINTHGVNKIYNIFKKYISYPSFKSVLDGKNKFSPLQFETIQNFLTGTIEPNQISNNIKNCIKYLNEEGFKDYDWEKFEKYAFWTLKQEREVNEEKSKRIEKTGKEEPIIYRSFVDTTESIYEQGYNGIKTYYIKYNKKTGEWEKTFEVIVNGIIHRPIHGEELEKQVVLLPKEPIEYNSDEELDQEIIDHIYKWLDVPEDYLKLVLYNIKLSWIYQRFNTLNYTRALGDTGTGKSRFLFTIGHIHYKPMLVAGALTSAVIFRLIDKWKGTLLIDEGDQKDSDENNSFIKIMNCGYEKGVTVSRCDKVDPNKINFFEVFCPKVLTTRRRFEDKATEARCMTTVMRQTGRKDIIDTFTQSYYTKSEELRGKLLMWRLRNFDKIDPEKGHEIDLSQFEPRLRQVNRAFVSLFVDNPDALNRFMEQMKVYQSNIIEERAESFDGIVINAIAELIADDWKFISPSDIVNLLNEKGVEFKYKITSRGIGRSVKSIGLEFRRQWVESGTKNILLINKERLGTIFSRYIVDETIIKKLQSLHYNITNITLLTETGGKPQKSAKAKKRAAKKGEPRLHNERNFRNKVMDEEIDFSGLDCTTNDILQHILRFGSDGKITIEQLKEDLSIKDKQIKSLQQSGELFEFRPGFVKVNK